MNYFMSLDPLALFRSMPGAFAQGMVWGLMALGVYITYRLLDFADLTVDGSLATGGAVAVMLIRGGMSPWAALIFAFLAGMVAGFITGILHTALGIPGILASILTQISLYSINLNIMGCSNQAVSVDKYPLVVSLRYLSDSNSTRVQILRHASCSVLQSLRFSIGISARSRDMPSAQPDVISRWRVRRESTPTFTPSLRS